MKKLTSLLEWPVLIFCTATVCFFLGVIITDLVGKGWSALSWEFITSRPADGMTKGGILPAILGTVLITLITALFAVPFGICCAV